MRIGCCIMASDTQPVYEVLLHDETGFLVDFFDHRALADSVSKLLEDEGTRVRFGGAAREFAINN